ncbi:MAG: SBBP repeat-containing protein, partial [Bacteroidia bacterium]|nr:SBBP repeat-containing protein [Bacteroidia bacterium]MDW8134894.1 SBBP repeat-containing protein [Bacteroidia bacterium]
MFKLRIKYGLLLCSIFYAEVQAKLEKLFYATPQRFFIENRGQWSSEVLYMHHQPGLVAWLTREGVVYDFYELVQLSSTSCLTELDRDAQELYGRRGHVIRVVHVGVSREIEAEGLRRLNTFYNYIKGQDNRRWTSGVPLYEEIRLHNLYSGVMQRWYFEEGRLRYDYVISPYGDPSVIRLRIEGGESIQVQNTKLLIGTRLGQVEICDLRAYQEIEGKRQAVSVEWMNLGSEIRLKLGTYDRRYPLIIDPYIWSRMLGGSAADQVNDIAISPQGKLVAVGTTLSPSFPTTSGAYDTSPAGTDGFLSLIDTANGNLLYSTFIGGGLTDHVYALAITRNGELCLTGETNSTDFPVSPGSYGPTKPGPAGSADGFILKLNPDGNSLLYGTYIGGSNIDKSYAIAVDATGAIYVTGETWSSNFPVVNPLPTGGSRRGTIDAFVLKLNPANNGTNDLLYSTYLGGTSDDKGYGIAVGVNGKAY